jgi:hypothetical protein
MCYRINHRRRDFMTNNEKTINAGQVEVIINPGRQSLEPFALTFGCSENERRQEQQFDWVENTFTVSE